MLKTLCKNLVWLAIPLGLGVGCASSNQPPEGSAFSLLAPDQTLVASSAYEGPNRTYAVGAAESPGYVESGSYAETPAMTSTEDVDVVPGGANPQSWAVAQEIQARLIADPTLAPMGSSLITQVGSDGVVTVRGTVASTGEQQRVCDSISSVPGVKSVNNQLTIGRASTSAGTLDMQNPQ